MKKLNEIESSDAFEIMDLEEKLDFAEAWIEVNLPCTNIPCTPPTVPV